VVIMKKNAGVDWFQLREGLYC